MEEARRRKVEEAARRRIEEIERAHRQAKQRPACLMRSGSDSVAHRTTRAVLSARSWSARAGAAESQSAGSDRDRR